ncbi:MAG TPA: ScbR family autoregulator-binding transcription factor [Actinocrinis sp.]|nr:ScbR family autoregulator-binding transcription factor [Actinocrinis sp.]
MAQRGGTGQTMQERAEATRELLLRSAAHLFEQHGFAGTSISDISRRSGLTSGAVYFHYANKENLAVAVVEEHFAGWPPLIGRIAASPAPALDKLVFLGFEVARAFRDDILVRAGSRLWTERKAIRAPLPVPFVGWIDTVQALLEQGRDQGDVAPDVDCAAAASVLVCAFFGTHTVSDALDGRARIEQRVADLWLLFLPALRPRTAPADLVRRARDRTGTVRA